jgi:4-amino-4-deoxy-L-arabinose transferase-like glycosyltransferase
LQHARRIGMLMAAASVLLGWVVRHSEPTFADGLRYIRQAEQIERGGWRDSLVSGVDHPLHSLEIAVTHRLVGGVEPVSWQRAALVLSFACAVLLVIPVYLLSLELFGPKSAWLACLFVTVNPIVDDIVVNVLSESTFLLWWTFGLWCGIRFLRDGKFLWLPPSICLGGLAYLTRPEGMLLPAALAVSLLVAPLFRLTRLEWPRWWRALAFMAAGPAILIGPYMALKGGVGTKPGIARVLGLAPQAQPLALERGKPVPPGQSTYRTYHLATIRMIRAFRVGVTAPLFPFALLGLVLASRQQARARAALFLSIVLAASAVALVRLHATGGYCTARHGLIPGILLTLFSAHAITFLFHKISIPGRWLGRARESLRMGPIARAVVVGALLIMVIKIQDLGPLNPGPYSVYHATSDWLIHNTRTGEHVLDLTGWPLYFSALNGYNFANVYEAPADPATRWIVVRQPHVEGHWYYSQVIRELIGGRAPVAQVPLRAMPSQLQILIYDLQAPLPRMAASTDLPDAELIGR